MEKFVLEKSLIRRLRAIMVAIAIFFLIGFFGIYLSSLDFLRGLSGVNSANGIFAVTTQAIDGIDTSFQNLEKLTQNGNIQDVRFTHRQAQKILDKLILNTIESLSEKSEIRSFLVSTQQALLAYDQSALVLFAKFSNSPKPINSADQENVRAELLVAQQFAMEAKESLRKAQIHTRQRSDELFSSIFEQRFRPLIVATILSLLFFTFVVTFGFSIFRRLGRSIDNLTKATSIVSRGDLNYQASILEPDEIGNLTFAFNQMVHTLREGRNDLRLALERIHSLQNITASFSEALTVDQVADVTVRQGFEALGAEAGLVALLKSESDEMEVIKHIGHPEETMKHWLRFPLNSHIPICETLRYSKPIFIESREEMFKRYPNLKESEVSSRYNSWAFLPLDVATSKLGGLGFYFQEARTFDEKEREYIMSVGRQCAQALHRSELYDEARKAIQARDEFLSIASHELKTPLTPLKLQLQMLARQAQKEQSVGPEKLVKIVETSDKQLGRLSRLIEDLLDVSRITTGRMTLNFEKFNLADMIQDVIKQYGHQLKDSLKRVVFDSTDDVSGYFDRVRLEQVLINLLTNAAKYAPGKPIKISLEKLSSGRARIAVTDQGPGIARENQQRIFDRFERVRGNDNIGGLGLGLYISKQIISAHGGTIWVESIPGEGATFYVDVPLHQAQERVNVEAQFH